MNLISYLPPYLCYFFPYYVKCISTAFYRRSHFFGFCQNFWKKVIYSKFSGFQLQHLIRSVVREANAAYMVSCVPNTGTAYLLSKFGPEIQNCQFKLKFPTVTNSNMQNSMVMFPFSFLDWKYLFLDKFGPKSPNYLFKVKFGM